MNMDKWTKTRHFSDTSRHGRTSQLTSGVQRDKVNFLAQQKKCAQLVTAKRTQYYSNLIAKCEGDQRALFKEMPPPLGTFSTILNVGLPYFIMGL